MTKKSIICHITTVHTRYDTRIFLKECHSLVNAGFTTILVVADGQGDEYFDGIEICDAGTPKNRLHRMFSIRQKVINKALAVEADIYHIHDPELLLSAHIFLKEGKKVIYDIHEDLPRQIFAKDYIPQLLKPLIAFFTEKIENLLVKRLTALVTVTPTIQKRFQKFSNNVFLLRNFPLLSLYEQNEMELHSNDKLKICYIGSISTERGIFQLLDAVYQTNSTLLLAGSYSSKSVQKRVENHPAFQNTHYFGYANQKGINKILSESHIGAVTLLPYENHIYAYPVKLFEYMAAGIPVIASDFPLWRKFVVDNNCGIIVNPHSVESIVKAITFLIENPTKIRELGHNGRKAVSEKYSWEIEEQILIDLYRNLLRSS